MKKIISIVGTRPQYIKMNRIMKLLNEDNEINHIIINTGQHYDYKLAQKMFEDLEIPNANYTLDIKGLTPIQQISNIMLKLEEIFIKEKPDTVLVIGDCNSTLAAATISSKLKCLFGKRA